MRQAITAARHGLRRRIWTLRLVSVAAPMLGMFGTCWGIVQAFRGTLCGSYESGLHCFMVDVSDAVTITALGLVIGILTHWAHDYCESHVNLFELEMKCAALELRSRSSSIRAFLNSPKPCPRVGSQPSPT
jgi:biopolymer transport protein ExbB/TolQ